VAQAAGRLEEHVERIALHAEQGGLWAMALDYLERAGRKAFALYANAEAAGFFERALGVLRHLPESRATLEQAIDLRFELRNALVALCELDRIRKCLEELEPFIASAGDKVRSARHAAFRCNHHFYAAEQRRAIEFGEAGLRLAREYGDPRVEGELLYRLGQSHHLLGDNRRAIALLEESIKATVEERERERVELSVIPAVVNRTWLVSVLAETGDFRAGVTCAKRALEIAERAEHPLSQVLGWFASGHLLHRKGELNGAIAALERGAALSERYALPLWRLRVLSSLGLAYACSGRVAEGLALARQALGSAERMGLMVDQPMLLVYLGEALLLAGGIDEALNHGERALAMALAHEAPGNEAWARFLIARARLASAPEAADGPGAELEAALRLADACGALPLAAFCKTALGEIHGRRGGKAEAEAYAAAAEATYADLDMRPLPREPVHKGRP
jgi:tetratricopeptide (TPR) repeat protein